MLDIPEKEEDSDEDFDNDQSLRNSVIMPKGKRH